MFVSSIVWYNWQMVILVVAHASLIMAYKLCRITTWLVIIINYPHFALMCVITYAYVNNIASVPTLPILPVHQLTFTMLSYRCRWHWNNIASVCWQLLTMPSFWSPLMLICQWCIESFDVVIFSTMLTLSDCYLHVLISWKQLLSHTLT